MQQQQKIISSCFQFQFRGKQKPSRIYPRQQKLFRTAAKWSSDDEHQDEMHSEGDQPREKYVEFLKQLERQQSLRDFRSQSIEELRRNMIARKNHMFLMIEEMRRLRIQKELKEQQQQGHDQQDHSTEQYYHSSVPFLGDILTERNLKKYYMVYLIGVIGAILFGGLIVPVLGIKLGLGGVSYREFIASLHLPRQLANVDPVAAAFSGGVVGVLSAVLVIEANNIKEQKDTLCPYCQGKGYLPCGQCLGGEHHHECSTCQGTGLVMCQACLFTGKQMVTKLPSDLKQDILD
eukprot:TRINITY_DN4421_c0_g1_i11.p2 TRINITY_DN4421_c0_g1~~TRINITY_DN4421_c0_g1_i11.p2  ORF type:complete len:291 (-),score=14.07 TRINITY_DN4421_c0_g1_i11:447-1319(-)